MDPARLAHVIVHSCPVFVRKHCQHESGITAQKRVDSPAGNCGVSLPTLFQRIGFMAANGDHSSLLAPLHAMARTTPTRTASGSGFTPDNRMPVAIDKPSSGAIYPVKTTPASIASGPAERLDNRRRMRADKPSSRTNERASLALSGRPRSRGTQHWSPSVCCHHAPARAGPLGWLIPADPD